MDKSDLEYISVKISGTDDKGERKWVAGIFVRDSDMKTAIVAPADALNYKDIELTLHFKDGEDINTVDFPVDVKFESVPEYPMYSICMVEKIEKSFYKEVGKPIYYACLDEDKIIAARPQDSAAPKQ